MARKPASRYLLFALATVFLSMSGTFGLLLGLDVYLHQRFERSAGLNIRGYRGAVVPKRKQPGEQRVVVLGGSTALGYGVPLEQSFPAFLERKLNDRRQPRGRRLIRVVNLAYNSEGAYAYLINLRSYDYLDYDLALFYTGYNDLEQPNIYVYRQTSPIFRLTGYMPIIPLVFKEKAMAIRYGGDLEGAYRRRKTVFKPNLAGQATASALEAAVTISQSLEHQLGRLTKKPPEEEAPASVDCREPWRQYCQSVYVAADHVLHRGKKTIIVTQPYCSDKHVEQQRVLVGMLKARFSDYPRFRHVNLGKVVDLHDPTLSYDKLHLTAEGNERIAEHLVQPVLDMLESDRNTRPQRP